MATAKRKLTKEQIEAAKQVFKDETYFDMANLSIQAHMLKQKPTPYNEIPDTLKVAYANMEKQMEYIKRRMRIRCRRHYGRLMYPHHVYGRNSRGYSE